MAADYLKHMVADACFKAFFKAKVLETGQSFATMETVDVGKPELEASVSVQDNHAFFIAILEQFCTQFLHAFRKQKANTGLSIVLASYEVV